MTTSQREKLINNILSECKKIRLSKGNDYCLGSQDANRNFKSVGEALNLSPETACMVYYLKHQDAILQYIRTGELKGEGIEEKIKDNINYLLILYSLIYEREKKEN